MLRCSKTLLVTLTVGLTMASEVVYGASRPSDQTSLHTLFGGEVLASNMSYVRYRASELSPEDKYACLKSWVLPSAIHPDIRIIGEFTPTNPSPRAMELEPWRFPSDRGGDLVSPVFDLLDAAAELNRLDDLHAEVTSISDAQENVDARAKLVLLILICLAQERPEDAGELITQVHQRLIDAFMGPPSDYSAELLMLYDAVVRKRALVLAGDLLVAFYENRLARNAFFFSIKSRFKISKNTRENSHEKLLLTFFILLYTRIFPILHFISPFHEQFLKIISSSLAVFILHDD